MRTIAIMTPASRVKPTPRPTDNASADIERHTVDVINTGFTN